MHHLFGTARGVMDAIFNGDAHDPLTGSTGLTFTRENNFGLLDEVRGIFQRIRMGFVGAAQLVVAAPRLIRGALSAPAPSAPGLPTPLRGPRGEDPSREPLSDDRVHARYETTSDRLDFIAAHHNGTANTLLTAVCANLLRRARIARGGPIDRPLQLLLPIDLPDEVKRAKLQERGKDPSAEGMMVTAAVVLEGGPPIHGDLALMRARMKEAYIADTKTAPAVRGAGDFLRLFPERVAYFFAAKAAVNFDGCVSNVGELPAEFEYLGDRQATAAEMIGFPIGNEMIAAITRSGGNVAMTFVTDPARMGDESDLRTWLAEELAHWGIDAPIPSTTT
jgi:hypothetical protein